MSRIETIGNATLYLGDCLDVLKTLPTNSVDSVVCDPPYGLSFMGKKWDYDVPSVEIWAECLRVLKPGGHLLAFAGTRTQHRMAVRIEDAGFEIRDMIAWVYGSGFPKSLDVSKALDKAAGAEREVVGESSRHVGKKTQRLEGLNGTSTFAETPGMGAYITAPATESAKQWQGWGTALKPALEPITMARKPFASTVAANVLAHGTGALNIDGCRVWTDDGANRARPPRTANAILGGGRGTNLTASEHNDAGRWPANLIHDGSDEVVAGFPVISSGALKPWVNKSIAKETVASFSRGLDGALRNYTAEASTGSAARFFYCAKASKRDRDEGLEGFEAKPANSAYGDGLNTATKVRTEEQAESGVSRDLRRNNHPTVKPTDLMAYLCRLVTPPGGVVLDPFMGSGSTGKAAIPEGFHFIGVECEPAYFDIARRRIEQTHAQGQLFEPTQAAPVQLGLEAA